MAQTEDIPYEVSDFATPEPEKRTDDVDQPNKSVLIGVSKYLDQKILEHNTLDVIEPAAEGVMTTQQQVALHKQVVIHLRNIKSEIDNKIKELR
jgi:hypothetical protein